MKRVMMILVCLCLLLCGCQLAQPEEEKEEPDQDRLVGMAISLAPLYLPNSVRTGQEGEEEQSIPRLNAIWEKGQWVFPGVDGMIYAVYAGENDTQTVCDPAFGIGSAVRKNEEDIETLRIEGTVYVDDRAGELVFYMHPIYQDDQGRPYLLSGGGISSGLQMGPQPAMSQEHSQEVRSTSDPERIIYRAKVCSAYAAVHLQDRCILVFLDDKSQVLGTEEYTLETLPGEVDSIPGTAYVLVEHHRVSGNGDVTVCRTILGEDEPFYGFTAQENGICIPRRLTVK